MLLTITLGTVVHAAGDLEDTVPPTVDVPTIPSQETLPDYDELVGTDGQGGSDSGDIGGGYVPPVTDNGTGETPDANVTENIGELLKEQTDSGGTKNKLDIQEDKVRELISQVEELTSVRVSIAKSDQGDVNEVSFSPSTLSLIKDKNEKATIEFSLENSSYSLPVNEINPTEIASSLGVNEADLKINIQVYEVTEDILTDQPDDAKQLSSIIEFKVIAEASGKKKEISNFTGYVERSIVVNQTFDPARTIAVRINADGTLTPIPTVFDGSKAIFKSLTNSQYTVIERDVKFNDIEGLWNKDQVLRLGSKMIFNGRLDGSFGPGDVTKRIHLAVLITRALGLPTDVPYDGRFSDVKGTEWYAPELMAAVQSGIINGKEDGTFAPYGNVTREQAAAMIRRAVEFVGYQNESLDTTKFVSNYKDSSRIQSWAREDVKILLQAGIMTGKESGEFDPRGNTTRAQVAKLIEKFLQFVNLMN